jgi:TP901 family phage tail tape measure protein
LADNFAVKLGVALDQTQFAAVQAKLKTLSTTVTIKGGAQQTITKLGDSYGNLYTAITKTNAATGQSTTAFTKLQSAVGKTNQSFTNIIGKVFKFGAATAVIGAFTSAVTASVQAVFDLNEALTDFRKVSDLSGESLNSYVSQLSDLGDTVARTTTEMVQNATIFKQAGYSDEDSAKLAQLAAMYQNVADSEISAQEAGSFIVSQMKAYNLTADNAITILDQLNRVSNEYAVSSSDIATGLTKGASAMSALGNSSQETIGLLTAGAEQLTGQSSKVIKGLQTIGINLANAAKKSDTLSISVRGAQKEIQLFGENGDILSTYDILKQIAGYWGDMTDAEKTAIASAEAGKTRFDVYSAVMNNFGDAIKATQTALDSAGSATQENAKYMDSLQAHLTSLKKEFQDLATNTIQSQFIKSILDAGTAILKFANSDIGQAIIKMTALGGTIAVLLKLLSGTNLAFAFQAITGGAATLAEGFTFLLGTINPVILAIGALATVIAGLVYFNNKTNESIDSINDKISDTTTKITDIQTKIAELQSQGASNSIINLYKHQLEDLNDELDKLNSKKISLFYDSQDDNYYTGGGLGGNVGIKQTKSYVENLIDSYKELKKQTATAKNTKEFEEYNAKLQEVSASMTDVVSQTLSYVNAGGALTNAEATQLKTEGELLGSKEAVATATIVLGLNSLTASKSIDASVTALYNEGIQAGLTADEIQNVILKQTLFNSQSLNVAGKIEALRALAQAAGATAAQMAGLTAANAAASGVGVAGVSKAQQQQILQNLYTKATAGIGATMPDTTTPYDATTTGGGGGGSTKQTDQQLEALKDIVELRKSELDLMQERGDSETSQIDKMHQIQDALLKEAEYLKAHKGSQTDINNLYKEYYSIQKDIFAIQQKQLEKQEDNYKKALSYVDKVIDKQIDALNDKKDAISDYYDNQIDALNDVNDELDAELDKQKALEELAKAQQQKKFVYKNGVFQYVDDIEAVSKAQENVDSIDREQTLKAQTKALQNAKDQQLAALDAEIKGWQDYKDKWANIADAYSDSQDELIAKQILGANAEADILARRLDVLEAFASQYKAIQAQLDSTSSTEMVKKQVLVNVGRAIAVGASTFPKYANGTTNASGGLSMTGEQGRELRVLNKGDGIIPHQETENLMSLGRFSPSQWISKITGSSNSTSLSIANITLPNVRNAEDFISGLKNYALQYNAQRT